MMLAEKLSENRCNELTLMDEKDKETSFTQTHAKSHARKLLPSYLIYGFFAIVKRRKNKQITNRVNVKNKKAA